MLPESTRWLAAKKKYAEAKVIYEKAAKLNKKEIPAYLLVVPSENTSKASEADGDPPACCCCSRCQSSEMSRKEF